MKLSVQRVILFVNESLDSTQKSMEKKSRATGKKSLQRKKDRGTFQHHFLTNYSILHLISKEPYVKMTFYRQIVPCFMMTDLLSYLQG